MTTKTKWTLILLALVAVGSMIGLKSYKIRRQRSKYRFENTTGGGVLQFKTFEDKVRWNRQEFGLNLMDMVATALILGGVFGLTFVLNML